MTDDALPFDARHSDGTEPAQNASQARHLVLHADDFGMNDAVNAGIIAGFTNGLLTSTSILANAPGFTPACNLWRALDLERRAGQLRTRSARGRLGDSSSAFDLGVHLNLTQGRPLSGTAYPSSLLDKDGRFPGVFSLLAKLTWKGARFRSAIRQELSAQIERALDAGLSLTHLNGHQYVEMLPVVSEIVPELLARYAIPIVRVARERALATTTLRDPFRPQQWGLAQVKRAFANSFKRRMQRSEVRFPRDYFGTAHAGLIDLFLMRRFVQAARAGMTEVGLHPGVVGIETTEAVVEGWDDPLSALRPRELEMLSSARLADLLTQEKITLGRLAHLAPAGRSLRAA